jgi:hypothetical protein
MVYQGKLCEHRDPLPNRPKNGAGCHILLQAPTPNTFRLPIGPRKPPLGRSQGRWESATCQVTGSGVTEIATCSDESGAPNREN